MSTWKLEKNKILAISKKKSKIVRCVRTIFSLFSAKCVLFPQSNSVIQLKIMINKSKFNKKLIFNNCKGVKNNFK